MYASDALQTGRARNWHRRATTDDDDDDDDDINRRPYTINSPNVNFSKWFSWLRVMEGGVARWYGLSLVYVRVHAHTRRDIFNMDNEIRTISIWHCGREKWTRCDRWSSTYGEKKYVKIVVKL